MGQPQVGLKTSSPPKRPLLSKDHSINKTLFINKRLFVFGLRNLQRTPESVLLAIHDQYSEVHMMRNISGSPSPSCLSLSVCLSVRPSVRLSLSLFESVLESVLESVSSVLFCSVCLFESGCLSL